MPEWVPLPASEALARLLAAAGALAAPGSVFVPAAGCPVWGPPGPEWTPEGALDFFPGDSSVWVRVRGGGGERALALAGFIVPRS